MQLIRQYSKVTGMALVLFLQRAPHLPFAKHVATLFGKAVGKIWTWRVAVPAMVGGGTIHSLSGATTYISSSDPNPGSGNAGENYEFGFIATGNEFAESYGVTNLPSSLSYNGSIYSPKISGTLPGAGQYQIFIKGYRDPGQKGESTPTYTLTLNVSATNNAPALSSVPSQETPAGTPLTITLFATDLDGDNISYSAKSDTPNVNASVSGNSLSLTPSSGWDGTANITVTASDGKGGMDTVSFVLDVTPSLGIWKDSNTTVLFGNWKKSNWFGTFYDNSNGWLYHQHHGWMYTSGTDESGLWLYGANLGWVYTGKSGIYPYLYRASSGTWLYYDASSGKYWEFTNGIWQ
jgi:hypothetical protein